MISQQMQASIDKEDAFAHQVKRVNVILLVMLAALIIGPFLATQWIARKYPVVSTVSIDNVQLLTPAAICAGQALTYAYDFHAGGAGVLIRDRVLWRMSPPPKTMIYSTTRRFILTEPIDQSLVETWHVPGTFLNPETDLQEPLPSGDYRLIFAISSPSRSTVVAIAAVDFEIGACQP